MNFPTSKRLVFRCWKAEDLPLAMSLWTDPEVTRHMGGPMSPEAVRARLQLEMDRQRDLGIKYWPVFYRADGDFAGCSGLRPFHNESGVFEVGVHIARRYWGSRLGEEAARAAIVYGFDVLGADALTAGHGPKNVNSKALLERLGFAFTHTEPWGPQKIECLYYRLERPPARCSTLVTSLPNLPS